MGTDNLKSGVFLLPGKVELKSLDDAYETARLFQQAADEIKDITSKLKSITQIDGVPVKITMFRVNARNSFETIGLRYTSEGRSYTREYSRQEFYDL